jgi:hypothetical protein
MLSADNLLDDIMFEDDKVMLSDSILLSDNMLSSNIMRSYDKVLLSDNMSSYFFSLLENFTLTINQQFTRIS